MNFLATKSASLGLVYIALCAAAFHVSGRLQLGQITDGRDATLRELMREPSAANVLCLGSSQTARAIVPAEVEQRAAQAGRAGWRVLNLAPFGVGRHIGFLQLARWLSTHPAPEAVVVEVGVTADLVETMHQMLPRYMDVGDALRVVARRPYRFRDAKEQARKQRSPPLVDPAGVFTAMDRFAMHLELAVEALGRGPEDLVRAAFNLAATSGESLYFRPGEPSLRASVAAQVAERGFYRVEPDSPEALEGRLKVEQQAARVDYERSLATSWDPAREPDVFADAERFLPAREYARALAALTARHNVRLVFLDLPNFRGKPLRASQLEFYRSLGELVQLDKAVLYREESFQDPGHLSVSGATYASHALAEHLLAPSSKR